MPFTSGKAFHATLSRDAWVSHAQTAVQQTLLIGGGAHINEINLKLIYRMILHTIDIYRPSPKMPHLRRTIPVRLHGTNACFAWMETTVRFHRFTVRATGCPERATGRRRLAGLSGGSRASRSKKWVWHLVWEVLNQRISDLFPFFHRVVAWEVSLV